ncbi:YraN family protein [Ilumatobacter nonamiensis]|uniref:YraN family protein n=1 Tax=Ilumatobacter nonamiensis TaxID=467093 RepID=UPI0003451F64|nr:YraN family protein [Ilumatobacter nonamiensis]
MHSSSPREPVPAPHDLSKRARGQWGEDLAAAHYRRLGYDVLDRNWRSPSGELDLIVERDGIIVFSEVKARRSDRYGPAAAAVGPTKQRRIRQLAIEYLDAHRRPRGGVRFDVVAITGVRIQVIEAAF